MRKDDKVRHLIAQEAAQIMYEEGGSEYRDAKRKAARHFGAEKMLSLGSHLPSNAEIHMELQRLVGFLEEKVLPERLLQLRLMALRQMELLSPFRPYLVGSVLSGVVTAKSDIDLHLFAGSCAEVKNFLYERRVTFEQEVVSIRHGGEFLDYLHIYLEDEGVAIECTVYPLEDLHRIPKSSITGRRMERADVKKLKKMMAETA
ncbi:MAG: hypothetical protein EHM51_02690 [Geobacter sp.]|nr:MAG: hypothetical protein EHM51_02690 [Geobacter sp.]